MVSEVHTHLCGVVSLAFDQTPDLSKLKLYSRCAVILAMPPGNAATTVDSLVSHELGKEAVVVDLSGDFRLRSEDLHNQHYGDIPFRKELRQRFTYGLPELGRDPIATSHCITNPGCLATAAILALAPLAERLDSGCVVIDGKTGTSGAGREPQTAMHHPSRSCDFTAYKALVHRHEPEIVQALGDRFAENVEVLFVPHLLPVPRGIFVTTYITQSKGLSPEHIKDVYLDFYRAAPFVRFRSAPPRLADVIGTNFCDIFVTTRGSQIVVMTTIDNLGKGMAGQAIQNLNLVFGLSEETGLTAAALGPT
jgi:N-acetyl-gamma-glutamyl-phosphate reductase